MIFTVLGVTQVGAAVYRELLGAPSGTAADLAVTLHLDEGSVMSAVSTLEARGLVTRTITRPPRFVAAPPDSVVERMLLARQAELAEARVELEQLVRAYRSGRRLRGTGELAEIITGAVPLAQRVGQLQRRPTQELSGFVKPPFLAVDPDAAEDVWDATVGHRIIYDRELFEHPGFVTKLRVRAGPDHTFRANPSLPMKLLIADRETALLPLSRDTADTTPSAVIVHASGLVDAVVALFEQYWEASTPLMFGAANGDSDGRLADSDRTILSMLVAGATDESIARQLGISVRTVRRRTQAMTHTAHAANRVQLAWYAAQHGLLLRPAAARRISSWRPGTGGGLRRHRAKAPSLLTARVSQGW